MFVEKYLRSLYSSTLQDDAGHHQAEVLAAVALADLGGGSGEVLGSLLMRAKYADGIAHKTFEAGNHNTAVLLRAWIKVVTQKGLDRQWLKIRHEWDVKAAHGMYEKIARVSLAHWLAGECETCNGTTTVGGCACTRCAATPGREPVRGGSLEVERIKDMIGELEGMYQSHSARAAARLRKAV